ncbi:hypothetical protein Lalb_Chr06g0176471 [Lupinus albus]|uniref:Uncharacterized protein n=1 Tax=Lupinus albus TaxID=3870 RepID=A0A6A4QGZ0_LUPAL|nr:hypothetical protein Lalb_Chr06g0176471 [Lupinus albus]
MLLSGFFVGLGCVGVWSCSVFGLEYCTKIITFHVPWAGFLVCSYLCLFYSMQLW